MIPPRSKGFPVGRSLCPVGVDKSLVFFFSGNHFRTSCSFHLRKMVIIPEDFMKLETWQNLETKVGTF